MQKRLVVHRIFPLEQYGNLQLHNEVTLDDEDWEELGMSTQEIYDGLVREVYNAALDHRELVVAMKEVKELEEKREVLNDGRD